MPLTSPTLPTSPLLLTGPGEEEALEPAGNLFGPLHATWELEVATVETLRTWMPEYLAELERKNGLPHKILPRPPAPESYHGGVDFDGWKQETLPEVIVVVEPVGEPERSASTGYVQQYDVQIGCVWIGTGSELAENPEHEARAVASYYGAASMLLLQQPTLHNLAERVTMTAPKVELPDPDLRQLAMSLTTFHVWIAPIISEYEGPVQPEPKESPEFEGPEEPWGEEPLVGIENLTIVVESIS